MAKQNNTPQEILEVIKSAKNVVTFMDSRFDFDSYCSVLLIKSLLDDLNIPYSVFFKGKINEKAKEIFPDQIFVNESTNVIDVELAKYDLAIFLDTEDYYHIPGANSSEPLKNMKSINIDHHSGNAMFGTLNFVDNTSSCATTKILYKLFNEWKVQLNKHRAQCILMGIIMDSETFQHDNVLPEDLRIVADMMDYGVDMFNLNWKVRYNETYEVMQLKALIYSNLAVNYKEKYAYSHFSLKDLEKVGIADEDKVGFSPADLLKTLNGVDFVFVVKNKGEGVYSVSMRSHSPTYNLLPITQKLGGGGHKMAGGATLKDIKSVEEAVKTVISALNTK